MRPREISTSIHPPKNTQERIWNKFLSADTVRLDFTHGEKQVFLLIHGPMEQIVSLSAFWTGIEGTFL